LDQCNDEELAAYLLQLVQALKYEIFHVSALSSFLVERALKSPLLIGHALFWHLHAENTNAEAEARFGLMKESFLLGLTSTQLKEFIDQTSVVTTLAKINADISRLPPGQRLPQLRKKLSQQNFPAKFSLPLSSSILVKGINAERSRVMDSAAVRDSRWP
jgi:phosphatidylinositol-4,5-bisphosphate 3-kinase